MSSFLSAYYVNYLVDMFCQFATMDILKTQKEDKLMERTATKDDFRTGAVLIDAGGNCFVLLNEEFDGIWNVLGPKGYRLIVESMADRYTVRDMSLISV